MSRPVWINYEFRLLRNALEDMPTNIAKGKVYDGKPFGMLQSVNPMIIRPSKIQSCIYNHQILILEQSIYSLLIGEIYT